MKAIYILLLIISLPACSYIQHLKDDGEMLEKTYEVTEFTQIIADNSFEFVFENSNSQTISIEAMEYILEDVELIQEGNTLIFSHKHPGVLQKQKVPTVTINVPSNLNITLNAPCELKTNELINLNRLSIVSNGSGSFSGCDLQLHAQSIKLTCYAIDNIGNFYLAGTCPSLQIHIEGGVNVWAESLVSDQVSIIHKSIGSCHVNVNESLNLSIFSSGNTYYSGNPENINVEKGEDIHLKASGEIFSSNN